MRRALREYQISGIKTTLPFFREVMEDEEFVSGRLDTGFIPRFNERRKPVEASQTERDMAAIAAALKFTERSARPSQPAAAKSRWAMSVRPGAR